MKVNSQLGWRGVKFGPWSVPEQVLSKHNCPHLRDPRAAGVWSEHLDQTDCQEGEGQSPVDVHEVVHDVGARALQRGDEEESSKRVNTLKLTGTKNHTYTCVDVTESTSASGHACVACREDVNDLSTLFLSPSTSISNTISGFPSPLSVASAAFRWSANLIGATRRTNIQFKPASPLKLNKNKQTF